MGKVHELRNWISNNGWIWWIVLIIATIILILLGNKWDKEDDEALEKYNNQREQYSNVIDSITKEKQEEDFDTEKIISLYIDAYQLATSEHEKRDAKGNIVLIQEQAGNFKDAMSSLDDFEREFGISKPTLIHRAFLWYKSSYEYYIQGPMSSFLCEQSWGNAMNCFSQALDQTNPIPAPSKKKTDAELSQEYLDYLFNYQCDLLANLNLTRMQGDTTSAVQQAEHFFSIAPQFNEVLDSYYNHLTNINKKNSRDPFASMFNISQRGNLDDINQQIKLHLDNYIYHWTVDGYIDKVIHDRWLAINNIILILDNCYGHERALSKTQEMMKNYQISGNLKDRYFYETYISLSDSTGRKSNISHEELMKLATENGTEFITILTPATIDGQLSSFISAGITEPRILLKCNDWLFSSREKFTPEIVQSYAGKTKEIVLLSDNYNVDTIHISTDKLGVNIREVGVDRPFYYLLLHDFDYKNYQRERDSIAP